MRGISPEVVEQRTIQIVDQILGPNSEQVGVRLWNGVMWPDNRMRPATLVLQHSGALAQIFSTGTEVGLAEAYLRNDFDIEGDISAAFEVSDVLLSKLQNWKQKLKMAALLLRAPKTPKTGRAGRMLLNRRGRKHSIERDREAVTFHYDFSNEFYHLWLDCRMVYSCAYFHSPSDNLDDAQKQKLDYVCRKLRLRPGQRLLDIGCGWGAFVVYAAKHFGVHAVGITLSERQAEWALARVKEAGLDATVKILVCDYRKIAAEPEHYDAIVSIGMAEHVGREQLPNYFAIARRLLKPGGVFMNQAIGEDIIPRPGNCANDSFIEHYVFPEGDIPPLSILLRRAESSGFEIRDVENLREHYGLTLEHWLRRLEAQHSAALAFVPEETYRVWRLYLAGSGHGFRRGHIGVYQTLLTKLDDRGRATLPLTRSDWYRTEKCRADSDFGTCRPT
jgi:cyclopropane-fatty-acyl-phospholipid synthase